MNLQTTPDSLYDLAFLEEMDDNDYLLGMLTLLMEETPKDLNAMKAAALVDDYDTVAKKAHVLKSTAGIISVTKFVTIMVAIESCVKEEIVTPGLLGLINDASAIFEQVDKGLREHMEKIA